MNHVMTLHLELITGVLALDNQRPSGTDFGKASPFGLIVVILLLIGVFALVWSMNRHLRGLPESFDRENPEADQLADDGTIESDVDPEKRPGQTKREPG